jgi:hypothetical protein
MLYSKGSHWVPWGLNLYGYANNNPIRYRDPSGLDAGGSGANLGSFTSADLTWSYFGAARLATAQAGQEVPAPPALSTVALGTLGVPGVLYGVSALPEVQGFVCENAPTILIGGAIRADAIAPGTGAGVLGVA